MAAKMVEACLDTEGDLDAFLTAGAGGGSAVLPHVVLSFCAPQPPAYD